jgi:hypothetical protein
MDAVPNKVMVPETDKNVWKVVMGRRRGDWGPKALR